LKQPNIHLQARTKYSALARDLHRHLGSLLTEISHIGGTAVPNLAGRSTVDILMITPDLYEFDQRSPTLTKLGYHSCGDGGRSGQRLLQLAASSQIVAELHVYQPGDLTATQHLLLRDYLRHNPEETHSFSELKLRLAARHEVQSDAYFKGKRPRLQRLLQHATGRRWQTSNRTFTSFSH